MVGSGTTCTEHVRLATSALSKSIDETLSSVLGSRFLAGLCRISVDLSSVVGYESKVHGLISKAGILQPKVNGSYGWQYFSINGRPVELPRISRILGDVWRVVGEGTKKRPACVLCFSLPKTMYDVNLSPNKREVMFTHEDDICHLIQQGIRQLWETQTHGQFRPNETATATSTSAMHEDRRRHHDSSDMPRDDDHSPLQPPPAVMDEEEEEERPDDYEDVSTTSSPHHGQDRMNRSKAKRRYAFVHDLRNARMQHESNDDNDQGHDHLPPQQCDDDDDVDMNVHQDIHSTGESQVSEETAIASRPPAHYASDKIHEQDNSLERAKMAILRREQQEQAARTESHTLLHPLPSHHKSIHEPTDAERLRWSEIQTKFNNHHYGDGSAIEKAVMMAGTTKWAPITPTTDDAGRAGENMDADDAENGQEEEEEQQEKIAPMSSSSFHQFAFRPRNPHNEESTKRGTSETRKRRNYDFETLTLGKHEVLSEQIDGTRRMNQPEEKKTDSAPEIVFDAFTDTTEVVLSARLAQLEMRCKRRKLRDVRVSPNPDDIGASETWSQDHMNSKTIDTAMINLTKDDFGEMTVLGQFNLGFILVRCRNNHLWILDQHACDEKYNFERLCSSTVIQEQRLIAPLPLDLSPSEEICILDNMKVFEANGFRLQYDPTKPPRRRFALTAIPHSDAPNGQKSVEFGKEDISAMCAMLNANGDIPSSSGEGTGTGADGSGKYSNHAVQRYAGDSTIFSSQNGSNMNKNNDNADKVISRLPKAIAMLANRACRRSIMIGTALNHKEMDKIVKRLEKVSHPWNCPHGRPTIRHVRDLYPVLVEDERRAAEYIAGPTVTILTQEVDP